MTLNTSTSILKQNHQYSNFEEYQSLYNKSIKDSEGFWIDVAKIIYWKEQPKCVFDSNFDIRKGPIFFKFMQGGLTNVCYNILDKHIERGQGERIAYYWEGNDGQSKRRITYTELRREVCKFANGLKGLGIKKGDRIAIYMPVSIECVVAMLACARIGAVHVVMFAGFSAEAVATRIIDSGCILLVSSDGCYRANKLIRLKDLTDLALDICIKKGYQKISNIVNKHLNKSCIETDWQSFGFHWNDQVDIWWHDLIDQSDDYCEPTWIDAEDPLFILYTSGSTGKPKGILHTVGGYIIQNYHDVKFMFKIKDGDVLFSTSDLGWLAAHDLSVYGGLSNCLTLVLMEGSPIYPTPYRIYEIIDRLKVNHFCTAGTVIRSLMNLGDHYLNGYNRSSLRILSSGGEPISYDTWQWFWTVLGEGRCDINNIYGQTESGAVMLCSLTGYIPMKPGSNGVPMFGVEAAVLDNNGNEIDGPIEGHLVYKKAWPSIGRTIIGNHNMYEMTYFEKFPGYYWTGDWVRRDSDGYYWVIGRIDDTINISGRLVSIIEIETAINEHRAVAEVAVVSALHEVKGEIASVFVVLNNGYYMTTGLKLSFKMLVRKKIGGFAEPDHIIAVSALPKTRSGKVMRRILNKIIRNDSDLGDISTLEDYSVLKEVTSKINQGI